MKASKLFAQPATYRTSAVRPDKIPPEKMTELALIGRSNVGKSSLLNALVGRRDLARVSRTPGRTQMLNFFDLGEPPVLTIVDLPGYGFAKAPPAIIRKWNRLIDYYLSNRASLRRCFLLIDARRGLSESDRTMLDKLHRFAVSTQIVLTKGDKLKKGEHEQALKQLKKDSFSWPIIHPVILSVSSYKKYGIDRMRQEILDLYTNDDQRSPGD